MRVRTRVRARVPRVCAGVRTCFSSMTPLQGCTAPHLRAVVGVAGAPSRAAGFGVQRVAPHPDRCAHPTPRPTRPW